MGSVCASDVDSRCVVTRREYVTDPRLATQLLQAGKLVECETFNFDAKERPVANFARLCQRGHDIATRTHPRRHQGLPEGTRTLTPTLPARSSRIRRAHVGWGIRIYPDKAGAVRCGCTPSKTVARRSILHIFSSRISMRSRSWPNRTRMSQRARCQAGRRRRACARGRPW